MYPKSMLPMNDQTPTIYPSPLGAGLPDLSAAIRMLDPLCVGYHLDIIESNFAPYAQKTDLAQLATVIKSSRHKIGWAHLMVTNPGHYLPLLHLEQGSYITIQLEDVAELPRHISAIRTRGWRPGIALSPDTPVEAIATLAESIDQITIMCVQPGAPGGRFIADSVQKIKQLRNLCEERGFPITIGADGGISTQNIRLLVQAGAQQLAVTTAIFSQPDYGAALQELQELARTPTPLRETRSSH